MKPDYFHFIIYLLPIYNFFRDKKITPILMVSLKFKNEWYKSLLLINIISVYLQSFMQKKYTK
jgi:hypothetical protein